MDPLPLPVRTSPMSGPSELTTYRSYCSMDPMDRSAPSSSDSDVQVDVRPRLSSRTVPPEDVHVPAHYLPELLLQRTRSGPFGA